MHAVFFSGAEAFTTPTHWAPFPAEIPRRCILASSRSGDVVLDPYCGSGTTLAEAVKLGRRAVGVDIYAAALALAREAVPSQLSLFPVDRGEA